VLGRFAGFSGVLVSIGTSTLRLALRSGELAEDPSFIRSAPSLLDHPPASSPPNRLTIWPPAVTAHARRMVRRRFVAQCRAAYAHSGHALGVRHGIFNGTARGLPALPFYGIRSWARSAEFHGPLSAHSMGFAGIRRQRQNGSIPARFYLTSR